MALKEAPHLPVDDGDEVLVAVHVEGVLGRQRGPGAQLVDLEQCGVVVDDRGTNFNLNHG